MSCFCDLRGWLIGGGRGVGGVGGVVRKNVWYEQITTESV